MTDYTTRLNLPIPELSEIADGPDAIGDLANLLAAITVVFDQGLASARPSGGHIEGRIYWSEDTKVLSWDDGTNWNDVVLADPAANVAGSRTLGTAATSAAAGNDSRLLAGKLGVKAPVKAVHTGNINVTNPGTFTYGGATLAPGDRVLLTGQSTGAQNGPWVVGALASSALARPADYTTGDTVAGGLLIAVDKGTSANSLWMMTTDTDVVIGTNSSAWELITAQGTITQAGGGTINTGAILLLNGWLQIMERLTIGTTAFSGNLVSDNSTKFRQTYTGTGGHTFTVLTASTGTRSFLLENHGSGDLTVARTSPDTFTMGGSTGATSFTLKPGEAALLHNPGTSPWMVNILGSSSPTKDETLTGAKTFSQRPRHGINAIVATATIAATAGKLNTFAGSSGQTVTMPVAAVGDELEILNIDASDTLAVTRASTDLFNGATSGVTATTISIPAGGRVKFVCVVAGNWHIIPQNTPLLPSGTTQISTAVPNPYDGQEVRVQNAGMLTDGLIWTFRYNASGGTYKWECVHGVKWNRVVDTNENITSATYADMPTVGPSVTNPLPGEYIVAIGAILYSGTASVTGRMSYAIGGTAATDADAILFSPPVGATVDAMNKYREKNKTIASTGQAITAKYKASSAQIYAESRGLSITPVRCS